MNLDHYDYRKKNTYKNYEFFSEGPRGRIHKVVRFTLLPFEIASVYNLSFGDWNEQIKKIDHRTVSNNGDAEKVIATVAAIIIHFTALRPDAILYIRGSNDARTRRYQMSIARMWTEIEKIFYVLGETNEGPELFRKNVNYDAFFIYRKESVNLEEQTESYMSTSKKDRSLKKSQPARRLVFTSHTVDDPDPYVREKAERAIKSIEKMDIPEDLYNRIMGKQSGT